MLWFCHRVCFIDSAFILKEEQRNAIKAFVDWKYVFAVLPTGFGKRLIDQVYPIERRGICFPGSFKTRPILTAQRRVIRLIFLPELWVWQRQASKSLRYQHHTWYIGGRHYNMLPCEKGHYISPKMIDIKQMEFIANTQIMLYISAGQKLILWFNNKFIWRLLRMFSTQIWEKVDCKMKSRFLVNIWNMHAWLIAKEISYEKSLSAPQHAHSTFSHTQPSLEHTRGLGAMHTQHFRQ